MTAASGGLSASEAEAVSVSYRVVYATEDGRRYHRRERALTSFTGPARETKAALSVPEGSLGEVVDPPPPGAA